MLLSVAVSPLFHNGEDDERDKLASCGDSKGPSGARFWTYIANLPPCGEREASKATVRFALHLVKLGVTESPRTKWIDGREAACYISPKTCTEETFSVTGIEISVPFPGLPSVATSY